MRTLDYVHVDVFSARPYGGNSLPVFLDCPPMRAEAMLQITQELRHFEAIFLEQTAEPRVAKARIFDLFEELPFAGHPLIGAAAVLQRLAEPRAAGAWTFQLGERAVRVEVEARGGGSFAVIDQGEPSFLGEVGNRAAIAAGFGLDCADLTADLPLEVASTGLRYLVVPLALGAIERARIGVDITPLLAAHGAQFAVLFDPLSFEIRHWNNDGRLEDVATGSAAGVVGAYAVKHGLAAPGRRFALAQGRFAGRPSRLEVEAILAQARVASVKVGGSVAFVGRGCLEVTPKVDA